VDNKAQNPASGQGPRLEIHAWAFLGGVQISN